MMGPVVINNGGGGGDGTDVEARGRITALEGKVDPVIETGHLVVTMPRAVGALYDVPDSAPYDLDIPLSAHGFDELSLDVYFYEEATETEDQQSFEVRCDVPLIEALWELEADLYGAFFSKGLIVFVGVVGRNVYFSAYLSNSYEPGTPDERNVELHFEGSAADAFGLEYSALYPSYRRGAVAISSDEVLLPDLGQTMTSFAEGMEWNVMSLSEQMKSTARSGVTPISGGFNHVRGDMIVYPSNGLPSDGQIDFEVILPDGSEISDSVSYVASDTVADVLSALSGAVAGYMIPNNLGWFHAGTTGGEHAVAYMELSTGGADRARVTVTGAWAFGFPNDVILDVGRTPFRAVDLRSAVTPDIHALGDLRRASEVISRLQHVVASQEMIIFEIQQAIGDLIQWRDNFIDGDSASLSQRVEDLEHA